LSCYADKNYVTNYATIYTNIITLGWLNTSLNVYLVVSITKYSLISPTTGSIDSISYQN